MIRTALFALIACLLAACGGLEDATGIRDPFGTPQPFRGDGDQHIVSEMRGERAVYVGAVAGLGPEDEVGLRKAIATNAAALDVLASAETVPVDSLTLTGKYRKGGADFVLADGAKPIAQFAAEGDLPVIAVGAARALAQTLGRLGNAPPSEVAAAAAGGTGGSVAARPARETPAAFIKSMSSPAKSQADPLRRAVMEGLSNLGVRMATIATDETYAISGALTLGPDQRGQTAVLIVWTVHSPDGRNLGEARQENALPTDLIAKAWPEQAALAGGAAARSIAQIIASDFKPR